jgi:LacI family transcriptional regulator
MNHKKITIQDIANTARVSKSTVSRVLNNTTPVDDDKKKAVLKAMKRLNFKPNVFARTLAGGCSMTLGIVTQNIGSPFYDSITQGVIRALAATEYSPIFVDGRWEPEIEKNAIATLIDRRVDGIIMVGGNLDSETMHEYSRTVPMVLIARQLKGWENRSVFIDNHSAAKTATRYLIDQGHRQIAHVRGLPEHQDAIDRFEGYQQALTEANLRHDERLVVQGDFSSRSGILAAEALLLRGVPFTAIFCANDETALGVRLSLYRHGIRVPEDISIVGFDDQPNSAFMTPPLTTIAQPALRMGETAAEIMVNILNQKDYAVTVLPSKLVVRESVAKI